MLDLHRLRLLRELHRRGTITAVAQALSYSPSAVSQQLAPLERETGVRLLEPAGRPVRLTAQADLLVQHADVLLAEMERAESALARSLEETGGTLRVAAFRTAVLTLIPIAITRLQSPHPNLRVEVTELEPDLALPALVSGDFDLVLGEEYPGHPLPQLAGTSRLDLFTDELLLAEAHQHLEGPSTDQPEPGLVPHRGPSLGAYGSRWGFESLRARTALRGVPERGRGRGARVPACRPDLGEQRRHRRHRRHEL